MHKRFHSNIRSRDIWSSSCWKEAVLAGKVNCRCVTTKEENLVWVQKQSDKYNIARIHKQDFYKTCTVLIVQLWMYLIGVELGCFKFQDMVCCLFFKLHTSVIWFYMLKRLYNTVLCVFLYELWPALTFLHSPACQKWQANGEWNR